MTRPITIVLPISTPPLSLNDRMHWRKKASIVATLRAMSAALARDVEPVEQAVVTLHYRPRDKRVRDAANLHATLKPLTDGLVDCGVLVKGDSSEYVDERCKIHPAIAGDHGALWLTIEAVAP